MTKSKFDLDAEIKKCKTMEDLTGKNGLIQTLLGGAIEAMLNAEIDDHLGYEKNSVEGNNSGNSRNGKSTKTVRSSFGDLELEVPRDRNGTFCPEIVPKRTREISSFDEGIISMYAKGMSVRDIQEHVKSLYGANISPSTISSITDKIIDEAEEWHSRPLKSKYAVVYFDAVHFKVRDEGVIASKAVYSCYGIDLEGEREILGIYIGESEGAKFWLGVCTELKQRGVEDILIACMDGLKGLPEAIENIFPEVTIQLCVVHQIRNSLKYIPASRYKEFLSDLKKVYKAPSKEIARKNLDSLNEKWGSKYPHAVASWINNWDRISAYFQFPEALRKIIYTTNAVEALHRQMRKVTKAKGAFPTKGSLFKMLYLAVRDIDAKRKKVSGWKEILSSLAIFFGDRVTQDTGA